MPGENDGGNPNPNPNPSSQPGVDGGNPNPNPNPDPTLVTKTPDWRQSLDEPYRDHVGIKPYATPNDLVKSHIELQRMVGADKIALPGKDATPEQLNEFYGKIGRPADAKGYELKIPDNLPAGVTMDEVGLQKIAESAHKLGIPKNMMQGLFNEVIAQQTEMANIMSKELFLDPKESMAKLQESWGQATEQKLAETQSVLAAAYQDLPWVKDWLETTQLGNSAPFLALAEWFTQKTRETGAPLNGKPTDGTVTPAEATQQMGSLMMDKEFMAAWLDKQNPGHAAAVKRYADLAAQSDPNKPTVLFDAADYFGKPRQAT